MEKRGLVNELKANEVSQEATICWADEMRLGLISQVRRIWCSIGTKVVQKIQISYKYIYLHLAVDGLNGKLFWQWEPNMKAESIVKVVEAWQVDGVEAIIWDGAPGHRANDVQQLSLVTICQPPYAPELNPAERVFEAIRQEVEGIVYTSLEAKQEAVESFLEKLVRSPDKIRSLAGWEWIRMAIAKLQKNDT